MKASDKVVMVVSAVVLAVAGYSGGLNRWGGAADSLPLVAWAVTLPTLGVWFWWGQRFRCLVCERRA